MSNATLDRHAKLISSGHRTYCLTDALADELAQYAESQYGIRTETYRRNGSIIVEAINSDRLRELSEGSE